MYASEKMKSISEEIFSHLLEALFFEVFNS